MTCYFLVRAAREYASMLKIREELKLNMGGITYAYLIELGLHSMQSGLQRIGDTLARFKHFVAIQMPNILCSAAILSYFRSDLS